MLTNATYVQLYAYTKVQYTTTNIAMWGKCTCGYHCCPRLLFLLDICWPSCASLPFSRICSSASVCKSRSWRSRCSWRRIVRCHEAPTLCCCLPQDSIRLTACSQAASEFKPCARLRERAAQADRTRLRLPSRHSPSLTGVRFARRRIEDCCACRGGAVRECA